MNIPDKTSISFNDVTLRDGEQAPGNTMTDGEKLVIAKQLVNMGINAIEAGFPAASKNDFDSVRIIAEEVGDMTVAGRKPRITGLARLHRSDIKAVLSATDAAPHKGVHTFISTSSAQQLKFAETISKRGGNPESRDDFMTKIIESGIKENFDYIQSNSPSSVIQFSLEDWTRTDEQFSDDVILMAAENGAKIINLPDTVGIGIPRIIGERVKHVRKLLDENGYKHITISWHGHNDTGMGVANAVEAMYGGARQFESTILGIGERTGNFGFESFIAALDANKKIHESIIKSRIADTIVRHDIMKTAQLVASTIGIDIQREMPIIGQNAFAHESGIHADGQSKGERNGQNNVYEILEPEMYGAESKIIIGKHSGWSNLVPYFERHQLPFSAQDRDVFTKRMKEACEYRRKGLSDEEVLQQVYIPTVIEITGQEVITSFQETKRENNCRKVEMIDRKNNVIVGSGANPNEGIADALTKAMQQLLPSVNIERNGYKVTSVGEGSEARAKASVTMHNGHTVTMSAEHEDTSIAICNAMIKCFNALWAIEKYEKSRSCTHLEYK